MSVNNRNNGFTLIEVIVVIVVLGVIASIAMKSMTSSVELARFEATTDELNELSRAIVGDERLVSGGYRTDYGYVGDVGALPSSLDDLAANPGGYSTWNGPYIRSDFTENTDDYKRDAWNKLYTYGGGITISSNGGGSAITKRLANSVNDLISNTIKGIVRDSGLSPPGDSASNVTVTIQYPDGSGSITSSSTSPSGSGEFAFASSIPIGLHFIRATDSSQDDTVSKYTAVNPGKTSIVELRFASSLWGGAASGDTSGGDSDIQLVENTEGFGGNCSKIEFDIINTADAAVDLTGITLSWASPEAYYDRVKIGGTLFNQPDDGRGSDSAAEFVSILILNPSQSATVEISTFDTNRTGPGSDVNMANTTFTITFSDGSTFDVTMGACP